MCLDAIEGPFEYACEVHYGTGADLSICGQDCSIQQFSCVTETLWMCAPGIATQEELRAMCLQACQAKVVAGQGCKVCGSSTGQIIKVERQGEGLCCGGNPQDPTAPFLKYLNGDIVTTLDGDIQMVVGDESATTSTTSARATYQLSNCSAGVCDITFWSVITEVADFQLAGRSFSNVLVESSHPFTGRIDLASSLFVVPAGAMTFYSYFVYNGTLNSMDMNNAEALVGFASPSDNAFRFVGTVSGEIDKTTVTVNITLDGTYENKGPPDAVVTPQSQTVECTSPEGATIQLDATGSTDPDGDALRFFWYESNDQIAVGATPSVDLSIGAHDITLTALDGFAESRASTLVTVIDSTGPSITAEAPTCMWPPNHKMVRLAIGSEIIASSLDTCDGAPGSVYISDVSTDDPTASPDDIAFGAAAVCLRAERPNNAARTYTITLSSVDVTGNVGSTDVVIQVPASNVGKCSTDKRLVRTDDDPACRF